MKEVRQEEKQKNATEQVRIDRSKQRLQQNENRARREQEGALREQQHLQAEKIRMIENDRIKEREKRKAAELQLMHEVDPSLDPSWYDDEFQHGQTNKKKMIKLNVVSKSKNRIFRKYCT